MLLKKEEIKETEENIKKEMNIEKDVRKKERLMFLYLIKSEQCRVMTKVGKILGKDRATMRKWALKYKTGGKDELLRRDSSNGVSGILTNEEIKKLEEKLKTPEGFISYESVRVWIQKEFKKEMTYKGVYNLCKYKLKTTLKIPRPSNPRQNKYEFDDFQKKL